MVSIDEITMKVADINVMNFKNNLLAKKLLYKNWCEHNTLFLQNRTVGGKDKERI